MRRDWRNAVNHHVEEQKADGELVQLIPCHVAKTQMQKRSFSAPTPAVLRGVKSQVSCKLVDNEKFMPRDWPCTVHHQVVSFSLRGHLVQAPSRSGPERLIESMDST